MSSENGATKKLKSEEGQLTQMKAVILDIEGTTTSISFVAKTLFPYIQSHLEEYLQKNWGTPQLEEDIQLLRTLSQADAQKDEKTIVIPENSQGKSAVIEAVKGNVHQQMSTDRKTTALKNLQGHMWRTAYEKGEIKGHIYEDTLPALQKFKQQGLLCFIYSSGSIEAQKLLFGFSEKGDLLPYFAGHFDTTSGLKVESQSYLNIFEQIRKSHPDRDLHIHEIMFATDNINEAIAAQNVHMNSVLLDRPGNNPLPTHHNFSVLTSLLDLPTQVSALDRLSSANLDRKFTLLTDHWSPKILANVNNQFLKIAKIKGEFIYHSHDNCDEFFLVHTGILIIYIRQDNTEKKVVLSPGDYFVVPAGVEHKPVTVTEVVEIILFELPDVVNTGNIDDPKLTKKTLDWL